LQPKHQRFKHKEKMAYTRLTAAEAAAMIKDQDNIGLSGFTPNGVPKATFRELSKRAIAEHEAGRPFQVGILTGASTSQSIEGDMAAANAIKFRAPFSTNKDFRTHTNMGEIDYEDMHLGHMAERLRRGFYGDIDLAIIEVSDLEEGETTCKAFLTSAGGIVPTIVRLAKKVLIEKNSFHSPAAAGTVEEYVPSSGLIPGSRQRCVPSVLSQGREV
jgi:propionyl-CoA:succinyl-CoA transferase